MKIETIYKKMTDCNHFILLDPLSPLGHLGQDVLCTTIISVVVLNMK